MWKWLAVFIGMCFVTSQDIYSEESQPRVRDAWARPTAPGQTVAAAYFKLERAHKWALIDAETTIAAKTEIHESLMQNGIMKMRKISRLDADTQGNILLSPMGAHLMLIGIKAPLKQGQHIPVTLILANASGQQPEHVRVTTDLVISTDQPDNHHRHH